MLSDVFPRPVRLTLAGRVYRVCQLRLRDLAYLEQFCRGGGPGSEWLPLLRAEALLDTAARHAALRAAYHAAEADVDLSDIHTAEGLTLVLWLALRRGQRFSRAEAVSVAAKLTMADWRIVCRVAWWLDPLDETVAAIDRENEAYWSPDQPGKGDWPELIAAVSLATGWSLDRIGNLTLSQWDAIRRHVAAPEVRQKRRHPITNPPGPPSGWTMERFVAEVMAKRQRFFSTDSANPTPDPPCPLPADGMDDHPAGDDAAPSAPPT